MTTAEWARILGLVFVGLLFVWFLNRFAQQPAEGTVQTSGQDGCRAPAEFEQLHFVIGKRGDRFELIACHYVGTRGTYKGKKP